MQTLDGLYIVEISDQFVRENFRKLKSYAAEQYIFRNLKLFEIRITGNVTNQKFAHNLGFIPKDIIQTAYKKANPDTGVLGTLTWNHNLFDKTTVDITTAGVTGTIIVRALIGNLDEGL